ncbi:hypothetical protein ACFQ2B_30305 [Streptomyces stramineus]
MSASSLPPVTVLSAVTTTLFVRGSTDQAVPGTEASLLSVRAAAFSEAALLRTILGTAPSAPTRRAASFDTTFTTMRPVAPSRYQPAVFSRTSGSSEAASRVADCEVNVRGSPALSVFALAWGSSIAAAAMPRQRRRRQRCRCDV